MSHSYTITPVGDHVCAYTTRYSLPVFYLFPYGEFIFVFKLFGVEY